MNEEEVLVGRIQDLAEQCYHRDVPSHTEFLTLAEQDLFYRTVNKIPGVRYVLSGGYEAAERKAALFLPSYAEDGDASMLPIAVVRISPLNEKFADALSHRDFLGSLMNLGVERYKLGDILIDGNQAYLICMADMADYICAELKKVRHTSVYCEVEAGLPEELTEPKTERKEGSVASVRLDAVLSLAFSSSRSKMVPLIEGGQVFINGKLVTSPSASLKEDDLVTVRHTSVYCEVEAGLPEELTEPKTERKEGSVASVRLDAVLSLAFSSSRSKMVPLIEGSQVFINGKLVTSPSASLKEDDLVTVRHMGKFRYVGVQNQTKKGRLYVAVERFVS